MEKDGFPMLEGLAGQLPGKGALREDRKGNRMIHFQERSGCRLTVSNVVNDDSNHLHVKGLHRDSDPIHDGRSGWFRRLLTG
jgi:hypothetical protein